MSDEINLKIAQKKAAAEKVAFKIETTRRGIEAKQLLLGQLETDLERQNTSLERMEKLAAEHAAKTGRLEEIRDRTKELATTHVWDPQDPNSIRLNQLPEYVDLVEEAKELQEQTKDTLPTIMSIFYGKA